MRAKIYHKLTTILLHRYMQSVRKGNSDREKLVMMLDLMVMWGEERGIEVTYSFPPRIPAIAAKRKRWWQR